jgi:hypothetical protein
MDLKEIRGFRFVLTIATLCLLGADADPCQATGRCDTHWTTRFDGLGMDQQIGVFAVFDDGSGPALYAGGNFVTAGGKVVNAIAKLQGDQWVDLAGGAESFNGSIWAMTGFDDGSGWSLFVGGDFLSIGGKAANKIARWDGHEWFPLGEGVNSTIRGAMAVFDDGTGPALYVGGDFTMAGGQPASRIAKWDGQSWSPVGTGMGGFFASVRALQVFDDGTGPALYVGGSFKTAGDVVVNGVARWDGTEWSAVGAGIGHDNPAYALVRGFAIFDDGGGPALYVTGQFATAGGQPAPKIAKWDGHNWSPLGGGLGSHVSEVSATGRRMVVFDDGSGPALYVAGSYTLADGQFVNNIAKWDGQAWSSLDGGMDDGVFAVTVFDEGRGPALFAGGAFTQAGGKPASHIAQWKFDCDGDLNEDGIVDLADYAIIALCLNGPTVEAAQACALADFDLDDDVDLWDFAAFQTTFLPAE